MVVPHQLSLGHGDGQGIIVLSETRASQKNKLILSLHCAVFETGREILLEMTICTAPAGGQFPASQQVTVDLFLSPHVRIPCANPDFGRLLSL